MPLSPLQTENLGYAIQGFLRSIHRTRDDRRYELTKLAGLKLMDSEEVFTPSGLAVAASERADALIAELDKPQA
jgi:hypothetical protein